VQYSLYSVRPSLAFSCIGSVTARQSSSGRQPKFAAWYKEWNYGTFAEGAIYIRPGGHHVGHRPTLIVVAQVCCARLFRKQKMTVLADSKVSDVKVT